MSIFLMCRYSTTSCLFFSTFDNPRMFHVATLSCCLGISDVTVFFNCRRQSRQLSAGKKISKSIQPSSRRLLLFVLKLLMTRRVHKSAETLVSCILHASDVTAFSKPEIRILPSARSCSFSWTFVILLLYLTARIRTFLTEIYGFLVSRVSCQKQSLFRHNWNNYFVFNFF